MEFVTKYEEGSPAMNQESAPNEDERDSYSENSDFSDQNAVSTTATDEQAPSTEIWQVGDSDGNVVSNTQPEQQTRGFVEEEASLITKELAEVTLAIAEKANLKTMKEDFFGGDAAKNNNVNDSADIFSASLADVIYDIGKDVKTLLGSTLWKKKDGNHNGDGSPQEAGSMPGAEQQVLEMDENEKLRNQDVINFDTNEDHEEESSNVSTFQKFFGKPSSKNDKENPSSKSVSSIFNVFYRPSTSTSPTSGDSLARSPTVVSNITPFAEINSSEPISMKDLGIDDEDDPEDEEEAVDAEAEAREERVTWDNMMAETHSLAQDNSTSNTVTELAAASMMAEESKMIHSTPDSNSEFNNVEDEDYCV